jgi:hypothetical protein
VTYRSGTIPEVCGSKVSYPSPQAAWKAADDLARTRRKRKSPSSRSARPYKCRLCSHWHLADEERAGRFRHASLERV